MLHGDSRAAVVVSTVPLLVAAYTDELDCVALLRFISPPEPLQVGSRLVTVNTYGRTDKISQDLFPGPLCGDRWTVFHPIIADFICDDPGQVARLKLTISGEEWTRAERLGHEYLEARPGVSRDGAPCRSSRAATLTQ
jgi:hypothetical protein